MVNLYLVSDRIMLLLSISKKYQNSVKLYKQLFTISKQYLVDNFVIKLSRSRSEFVTQLIVNKSENFV